MNLGFVLDILDLFSITNKSKFLCTTKKDNTFEQNVYYNFKLYNYTKKKKIKLEYKGFNQNKEIIFNLPKDIICFDYHNNYDSTIVSNSKNLKCLKLTNFNNKKFLNLNYENIISLQLSMNNNILSTQNDNILTDIKKFTNLKELVLHHIYQNNTLDLSENHSLRFLKLNYSHRCIILPKSLESIEINVVHHIPKIKNLNLNKNLINLKLNKLFHKYENFTIPKLSSKNLRCLDFKNIIFDIKNLEIYQNLNTLSIIFNLPNTKSEVDRLNLSNHTLLKKIHLQGIKCNYLKLPKTNDDCVVKLLLLDIKVLTIENQPNLRLKLIDSWVDNWKINRKSKLKNLDVVYTDRHPTDELDNSEEMLVLQKSPFYYNIIITKFCEFDRFNYSKYFYKIKFLECPYFIKLTKYLKLMTNLEQLYINTHTYNDTYNYTIPIKNNLHFLKLNFTKDFISINLGKLEIDSKILVSKLKENDTTKIYHVCDEDIKLLHTTL